jgi:hypothetical protein
MQIIRSATEASNLTDPALRHLIQQRIDSIASDEPYDASLHGIFVRIEIGDTLQDIFEQTGLDLLVRRCEIAEQDSSYWSLLYIVSDDGYAVEFFVKKVEGIDTNLVAMCQKYALPGQA